MDTGSPTHPHIHPPSPHLSIKPPPQPPVVPSVPSVIKIHLGPGGAGLELGVRSRDEHSAIPSLENLLILEATDLQTGVASCDKSWLERGKGCPPWMQTRELQLWAPGKVFRGDDTEGVEGAWERAALTEDRPAAGRPAGGGTGGARGWAGLEAGLGAVGMPRPPLTRTPLPVIHPDRLSPPAHLQAGEPGCDFLEGAGRCSVCRLPSPPRPWMQEAGSGFDTVEADAHLLSSCCVPCPGNCGHKFAMSLAWKFSFLKNSKSSAWRQEADPEPGRDRSRVPCVAI